MRNIYDIARAELQSLFYSPIAWLILIIFTFQSAGIFGGHLAGMVMGKELGYSLSDLTYKLFVDQWSGGIFLLEIDKTTGLVIHPEADEANNVDPYYGKRLLGGGHISIEGPYIMYDEASGYYYLFVSYGALTSNGGYQVRVFRSKTVDGDYVDMNGKYPEKSAQHQNFGLGQGTP